MRAQVQRRLLGNKVEYLRGREHDSGECPVALRMPGLFLKILNDIFLIHRDNAATIWVGNTNDAKNCRQAGAIVKLPQLCEVEVRENISIENEKGFFSGYEIAIFPECSGAAEELFLF